MLRKGDMPTVNVIDELHANVFGFDPKEAKTAVAAADAAPADGEYEELDPMDRLDECARDFETPQKNSLQTK